MHDRSQVQKALTPMRDALLHDGYSLEVVGVEEQLSLRVLALKDACVDCLVPPAVMAQMVSAALDGTYSTEDIAIEYPS